MSESITIPINSQGALINHLWQSTALVLLIWTLTLFLRKHRASLRYRLWMAASLKFLLPLSFLIEFGRALRPSVSDVSDVPVPRLNAVLVRSLQLYAGPSHPVLTAGLSASSFLTSEAVWIAFVALWGIGVTVILAFWLRTWLRIRDVRRRGQPCGDVSGVWLVLCQDAIDPGVFGLVKPTILLPAMLKVQLSAPELDTIYAHELCHIRRRDNLTFALHAFVQTVFWFHPAVWFIGTRLVNERERACDEYVIASGVDTDTYASTILSVCRLHLQARSTVVAGVTGGDLRERIERICSDVSTQALSPARFLALITVALFIAAVPVLLGLTDARQVLAQSSQTSEKLNFDVAGVRLSKEGEPSSNVPLGPGNVYTQSHGILRAKNFPLLTYLVFAYKLTDYQKDAIESAAPDWFVHERYSIEARTDRPEVTKDELRSMMRTFLAERFRLAAHYEQRPVRVFALVSVKTGALGPKLRPHPAEASCLGAPPRATTADGKSVELPIQPQRGAFPLVCNGILGLPASAQDRYSFGGANVPMSLVASSLSSWGNLGRPVIDQTEASGTYDFVLDYTPDPRPSYATIDSGGPGFQQALKEQLGLKLEDRRAPVEFLLLDHVQRPDAN